jgi:hypothetical protein
MRSLSKKDVREKKDKKRKEKRYHNSFIADKTKLKTAAAILVK